MIRGKVKLLCPIFLGQLTLDIASRRTLAAIEERLGRLRPPSVQFTSPRLKNGDVQLVLETLIEVWTEELVSGGRITLENLVLIDTKIVERTAGGLLPKTCCGQIKVRASKALGKKFKQKVCVP